MRLVRYTTEARPVRIGAQVASGVVDVAQALWAAPTARSAAAQQWLLAPSGDMTAFLEPGRVWLEEVAAAVRQAPAEQVLPLASVQLLAPVSPADKLICAWINYDNPNSHVVVPERRAPLFFAKFFSAVVGPGAPIVLPSVARDVIPEAELAVVIGRPTRHVDPAEALQHVAGYTIFNDVTALSHTLQALAGTVGPYMMAKTFASFAPIGPCLVTADEVPDPNDLKVRCWQDDALVVDSTTQHMLTPVATLIAYLSTLVELRCGDVIACGGAPWLAAKPPMLRAGQRLRIEVESLGVLDNPIVNEA